MNKKPNSNSSAGTTADSDKTPKVPTSSHACSNTFVIGSQTPVSTEKGIDEYLKPSNYKSSKVKISIIPFSSDDTLRPNVVAAFCRKSDLDYFPTELLSL